MLFRSANAKDAATANGHINEALKLFESPDAVVLIRLNNYGDYDRPTTAVNYLNYLKDQKKVNVNVDFKPQNKLLISRLTIVGIQIIAITIAASFSGSYINDLGFLSMGLRTTATFVPLTLALFFPGKFKPKWAFFSIVFGTACLIFAEIVSLPIDSIYIGLTGSILCCLIGMKRDKKLRIS